MRRILWPTLRSQLRSMIAAAFVWVLIVAPCTTVAQEPTPSLFQVVQDSRIEVTRLTGRSPAYFQPMILLEARNRSGSPLTVAPEIGSILRSTDSNVCDVVLLEAATPIYFDGATQDPFVFYIYGFCLQPAPKERQFPANTASYRVSDQLAPDAVIRTLQRVIEQGKQNSFASQLAVWLAVGVADDLAGLEGALAARDLSGYQGAVERLYPALSQSTLQPTAVSAPTTSAPTVVGAPTVAEPSPTQVAPVLTPSAVISAQEPTPTPAGGVTGRLADWWPLILIAGIAGGVVAIVALLIKSAANSKEASPSERQTDVGSTLDSESQTPSGSSLGRTATPRGYAGGVPERYSRPAVRVAEPVDSRTGPMSVDTHPGIEGAGKKSQAGVASPPKQAPDVARTLPLPLQAGESDNKVSAESASAPAMDKLTIRLYCSKQGLSFEVPAQGGILSRAGASEIQFLEVSDQQVSTPHALIQWSREGDSFSIKDLGSESGTLVNGAPIRGEVPLQNRDRVQVGQTQLTFNKTLRELSRGGSRPFNLVKGTRWIVTRRIVEFIPLNKVNDGRISAPHAYLEVGQLERPANQGEGIAFEGKRIWIRDLNSTNGTYVHDRRVMRESLVQDDVVKLGDTEFEVSTNLDFMPERFGENGRFEKRRLIEEGGMARVYQYLDRVDGQFVAVKVPRLGKFRRSDQLGLEYRAAFDNEVRITRQLKDSGMFVPAQRVESVPMPLMPQQVYCLVLDYVDGPALSRVIAKSIRVDPSYVVEIGWRLANALAHMHKTSGWAHCDVKPSNILVSKEGEVFLTDLGITRRIGDPLPAFKSDGYWPPEATRGAKVAPTLDIYSLGVVLYELIMARRFVVSTGTEDLARGRKAAEDEIKAAMLSNGELARIVLKCLAPVAERYQDMAELAVELSDLRRKYGADVSGDGTVDSPLDLSGLVMQLGWPAGS